MKYIENLRKILNIVNKQQEITSKEALEYFDFRIINNTKGKNYIFLDFVNSKVEDDKIIKKVKEIQVELKQYEKYIDYIETQFQVDKEFKNQIYEICPINSVAHRNSSYISWLRKLDENFTHKNKILCGYSYKGGMGRSSLLAYLAYMFYFIGKKVVVLDLDFEAPGVTNLFFEKKIRKEKGGVLDYILDYSIDESINFLDYVLQSEISDNGGNLYGFHSGLDYDTENYLEKISKVDFNSVDYIKKLDILLTKINEKLNPDIILIDLRAGLNESNGALLKYFSSMNLFIFNSEEQNKDGIRVINKMLDKNSYLVNSTIRYSDEELASQKKNELLNFIKNEKIKFNEEVYSLEYNEQILNNTFLNFKTFSKSQSEIYINTSEKNIYSKELITNIAKKYFIEEQSKEIINVTKIDFKNILEKLNLEFSKNVASKKFQSEDDLKYFYFKDDLKKIVNEQVILILGPKGSGKSTFYEIFTRNYNQIHKHLKIRNNKYIEGYSNNISTIFSREFINTLELKTKQLSRKFWTFLNLYLLEREINSEFNYFRDLEDFEEKFINGNNIIEVEKMLKNINLELMKQDKIITLVFDELDVKIDKYRDIIISGLIENSYDNIYTLPNLKSKILLRNDIYNSLKIDNKTHLSFNTYELRWDKKDLFSLILKIIVNCLTNEEIANIGFDFIIDGKDGNSFNINKNEELVKEAIKKLFGEKPYKASNVGSSYDWIIKQLFDGKEIITPRTIYKFMSESLKKELEKYREDSKERVYLLQDISTSATYKEIFIQTSKEKFQEYDEEYKDFESYDRIRKIEYLKFSFEEFKKTFAKNTSIENINKVLDNLIESGFLMISNSNSKSNVVYQVANIYAHSIGMKKNKKREKSES
ncbi:MAG: P-loop ATPase, Sll1717 family [Cetobacterium sp.]